MFIHIIKYLPELNHHWDGNKLTIETPYYFIVGAACGVLDPMLAVTLVVCGLHNFNLQIRITTVRELGFESAYLFV